MRYLYLLLLSSLFPLNFQAQEYSSNWEGLFSYYNISDITPANSKIYVAAQNAIFSYNTLSGETNKISTINGISGENITTIHYSSNYNLLLIGYETGLINVYDLDTEEALQVIDITEKVTIPPDKRRVNHFFEVGDQVLISTNYGISAYNLANSEFSDTYFIGNGGAQLRINEISVFDGFIYAASQGGGVRYAGLDNPNLIDFSQWQQIPGEANIKNILTFNDKLYAIGNSNSLYRIQNNSLDNSLQFNNEVKDAFAGANMLLITFNSKVEGYNAQLNQTVSFGNAASLEFEPNFSSSIIIDDQIFVGDKTEGLLNTFTSAPQSFQYLSPLGPLFNMAFNMEAIPNELWVVFGEYTATLNPYPLNSRGVSHLFNDEWINIPFEELGGARSIGEVTIDPQDSKHVFLSSYFDGLLELFDNELINLYDQDNSALPEVTPGSGDLRTNGTAFNNSGDLWIVNSLVDNGLAKLPAGSSNFELFDLTSVITDPKGSTLGLTKVVIDNAGNIYFGSSHDGVVGYQPSTQTFAEVNGDEGEGNLPDNFVSTLTLDNNNQLWIGTLRGLRVLFGPSAMFTDQDIEAQEIIILDDDNVAQELLAGITIADIEVDGNNNKWIATGSGAFYLSANGQETIFNFTTSNSPIPSNNVTDIEVDGSSGLVYIGTDKGIVAFKGTATSSQETLENVRAYPNPVRPQYAGMVTIDGLIENANVKITDIEGNLVYEDIAQGGSMQWDTRAFGKYKVASGVYLVLITSEDQVETKVSKIMIIR